MDTARDLTNVTLDGRYLLTRLMGEGGMGQVYEGIHGLLDRKIAVKVLLPRYAYDVRFRERFLREAKAASKVRHPNIVQILDFGETPNGSVYFAMEFLEGHDLLTLLRQAAPLPWARARHMLLQITSALGAAHERKIIHRDIKPANFFIINARGHREFIKVLDFGIAKIGSDATDENTAVQGLTGTNEVFGTAKYMAPEQAYGVSDDPRVDIYSVGVVAYQMLTGVVPFTGVSAFHIITRHVSEAPLPPRELNPAIPPAVEEIILRALAKNPAHRFASMDEMGRMLSMIPADRAAPAGAAAPVPPAPHHPVPITASHTEIVMPRPGDPPPGYGTEHPVHPTAPVHPKPDAPPFTAPPSLPPGAMDLAAPPWDASGRRATVPAGFGPSAFEPGHRIPSSSEPPGAESAPVSEPTSPPAVGPAPPEPSEPIVAAAPPSSPPGPSGPIVAAPLFSPPERSGPIVAAPLFSPPGPSEPIVAAAPPVSPPEPSEPIAAAPLFSPPEPVYAAESASPPLQAPAPDPTRTQKSAQSSEPRPLATDDSGPAPSPARPDSAGPAGPAGPPSDAIPVGLEGSAASAPKVDESTADATAISTPLDPADSTVISTPLGPADSTADSAPLAADDSTAGGSSPSERRGKTLLAIDPEVLPVSRSEELATEASTSRMRGASFDDGATSPGESEGRHSATDSLAAVEATPPAEERPRRSSARRGLVAGLLVVATAGGLAAAAIARSSSDEPAGATPAASARARVTESRPPPPAPPMDPVDPSDDPAATPTAGEADTGAPPPSSPEPRDSPDRPPADEPAEPEPASPATEVPRRPPPRTSPPPLTDKRAKSRLSRALKRKCRATSGAQMVTIELLVGSTGRVLSKTFQGASSEQRTCLSGGLGDAKFPEGTTRKITFSVAL